MCPHSHSCSVPVVPCTNNTGHGPMQGDDFPQRWISWDVECRVHLASVFHRSAGAFAGSLERLLERPSVLQLW